MVDEEKQEETKEEEPTPTVENTEDRVSDKEEKEVDLAKREDYAKREKELLEVEEEIAKKKKLSGESEAGQVKEKPKVLTDTEYAEALERGEVNPLKEDGII